VRRSTSTTLPRKSTLPGSTFRIASIGSVWRACAARTACPIAIAFVVVPRMPQSLTSRPVRGALQVEAIEPYSTQILRLTRSIHFHVGTLSTIDSRPRTSTVESG
jgi:hypothetical protein